MNPSARQAEFFSHEPLDHKTDTIRLIRLLAHTPSSPVRCRLLHLSLSATNYICLSYVWGPRPAKQLIQINGKPFLVRQNLYDYLLRARGFRKRQLLWIDAICIDQTNNPERNHQVALMSQIYSRGALTDVWLGCGDLAVESLFNRISRTHVNQPMLRFLLAKKELDGDLSGGHRGVEELNTGVRRLHDLKYWSRLWIMQEFVLSRHLELRYDMCVLDCDEWYKIWLSISRKLIPPGRMTRIFNLRYHLLMGHKLTLNDVLDTSEGDMECEDRRDKIYGVLGLATFGDFRVDYDEPVERLFFRALELVKGSTPDSIFSFEHWFDSLKLALQVPDSVIEDQIRLRYHIKIKIKTKQREGRSCHLSTSGTDRLWKAIAASEAAYSSVPKTDRVAAFQRGLDRILRTIRDHGAAPTEMCSSASKQIQSPLHEEDDHIPTPIEGQSGIGTDANKKRKFREEVAVQEEDPKKRKVEERRFRER